MAKNMDHPNPDLKSLEPLVGTWKLSGDSKGTVTYRWMDGGYFLVQDVDMTLHGHEVKAIEVIGHLHGFNEEPSNDIRSRAYDNRGNTFDYIYELENETLMIWAGEKGSPAYFNGKFSDDGDSNIGEWIYPGGGYKSNMTRIK